MKNKKISYLQYSWENFYLGLFILALAFFVGMVVCPEGLNKLFAITPLLAMIALVFGSIKSYKIYYDSN